MNKEDYRILKEINSLTQELSSNQLLIKDELGRIEKINIMRDSRKLLLKEASLKLKALRLEMTEIDNSISANQTKLEKSISNKANVFAEAEIASLEKQIASLEEQISQNEESGLIKLEELEVLEEDIKNCNSFLTGSLESITEIQEDIKLNNKPVSDEINAINKRIELLYQALPSKVLEKLQTLLLKKLPHGPLTYIKGNSCQFCGSSLPVVKIEKIEKELVFSTCSTCSRIFIPETSLY